MRLGRGFPNRVMHKLTRITPVVPVLTPFTTAGAYTYSIPSGGGYTHLDVIGLGAAGGGAARSSGVDGRGGGGGIYAVATLILGVDITGSTVTGSVGTGGTGGASLGAVGSGGGSTTASGTGWAGLTAAGGAGSATAGAPSYVGLSPGNENYNGQIYTGGAAQSTYGAAGNAPGGGGAGAQAGVGPHGGAGATGAIWFYIY